MLLIISDIVKVTTKNFFFPPYTGSESDSEESNYTQVEISAESMEDLCQMPSQQGAASKSFDETDSVSGIGGGGGAIASYRHSDSLSSGGSHELLSKKQTNYAELEFGAR